MRPPPQPLIAAAQRFATGDLPWSASRRNGSRSAKAPPAAASPIWKQDGGGAPVVWLGGFRAPTCARPRPRRWRAGPGPAAAPICASTMAATARARATSLASPPSDWLGDALAAIQSQCGQRPILVGSSMGGWIALLAARRLLGTPLQPAGLVLIAPAVDFSEELMWAQMPDAVRRTILDEGRLEPAFGVFTRPDADHTRPDRGRTQPSDVRRKIRGGCPVHILQGMRDPTCRGGRR